MTTITPRTATVAIYHGDDLEHLAELYRAAELAQRRAAGTALRVGDDDAEAQTARDAYDAAADEAAERAVIVRLTQVGRKAFRALLVEHAPREGNEDDERVGYNEDTFPEALLLESVTEPEMNRANLTAFLDAVSDGDFEKLFTAAYMLNRTPGADPKDVKFSAGTHSSAETSSSPARLG
ncbi:hypothetical protein [Nocardioides sp. REDSEA-S30_B4]|jgi:uncharacterized protein YhfF|uniref:hypothetical protein n=1 Tax=Nocardioides sp. REDSEA-S30_B4 TaxID=1811552 RepID=UPI000AB8DE3E|nr:hypothetical protein [Nocardioides sp. REDSEA-S30_B4]